MNIADARNALDRIRLKLAMFHNLFAHYPPEEELGEDMQHGICIFMEDLQKEIETVNE